ncbi:MAG: hypothetical protein HY329_00840 [Chloroflexi bacterium]|nr:hypothetical protein [Chloroflexota bacterium]
MYGKRAKLGIVVPSVNFVMEPELNRMAPEGVNVYAARMRAEGSYGPDTLNDMSRNADYAAEDLKAVADVIAYGCTSGSFVNGPAFDAELVARFQKVTGKPSTTTSTALTRGLRELGVKRIAIATPYTREVNDRMVVYFQEQGLEVLGIDGLGVTRRGGQGDYEPQAAYDLARKVDSAAAEAIVISCTNFRTIDILESLERDLGKPVISSNQATLWDLLRIAGIEDQISGFGQLLARPRRAEQLAAVS